MPKVHEIPYRFPEAETVIERRAILRFYPFTPLQVGDYVWHAVEGAAVPAAVATSPHGQEVRVESYDRDHIRVTINGQDCGIYRNSAEVPNLHLRGLLDDLIAGLKEARRRQYREVRAEAKAADAALRVDLLQGLASVDLGPLGSTGEGAPVLAAQLFYSGRRRSLQLGATRVTLDRFYHSSACSVRLPDSGSDLVLDAPRSQLRGRSTPGRIVAQAMLIGPARAHPGLERATFALGSVAIADVDGPEQYTVGAAEEALRAFVAALAVRLAARQAGYLKIATARLERKEAAAALQLQRLRQDRQRAIEHLPRAAGGAVAASRLEFEQQVATLSSQL